MVAPVGVEPTSPCERGILKANRPGPTGRRGQIYGEIRGSRRARIDRSRPPVALQEPPKPHRRRPRDLARACSPRSSTLLGRRSRTAISRPRASPTGPRASCSGSNPAATSSTSTRSGDGEAAEGLALRPGPARLGNGCAPREVRFASPQTRSTGEPVVTKVSPIQTALRLHARPQMYDGPAERTALLASSRARTAPARWRRTAPRAPSRRRGTPRPRPSAPTH